MDVLVPVPCKTRSVLTGKEGKISSSDLSRLSRRLASSFKLNISDYAENFNVHKYLVDLRDLDNKCSISF